MVNTKIFRTFVQNKTYMKKILLLLLSITLLSLTSFSQTIDTLVIKGEQYKRSQNGIFSGEALTVPIPTSKYVVIPPDNVKDSLMYETGKSLIEYQNTHLGGKLLTIAGGIGIIVASSITNNKEDKEYVTIISSVISLAGVGVSELIAPLNIRKSGKLLSFKFKKKKKGVEK